MSKLIDSDDALLRIEKYFECYNDPTVKGTLMGVGVVLGAMPPAEPERKTQWIFCKDQLPEVDENVLVALKSKTITIGWRCAETCSEGYWFIYEGEADADNDEILAWMPLPSPPEL